MSGGVALGQYINNNSIVHRLDPRTKLLLLVGFLVAVLFIKSFVGLAIMLVFFAVAVSLSKIKWNTLLKCMKTIMFILLISTVLNLFMTPGRVVVSIGFVQITLEGIKLCIRLIMRLFLIVAASSVLTFTTTPTQLTDGISSLLSPLTKIGVPVQVFSMITSIALRFIPTLYEETDRIIKAQKSRGAEFESGNIVSKLKAYVSIIVPLLVSSFMRADELANAMDARGYDSRSPRTSLKTLRFGKNDLIAGLLFLAVCILLVIFDSNLIFRLPEALCF